MSSPPFLPVVPTWTALKGVSGFNCDITLIVKSCPFKNNSKLYRRQKNKDSSFSMLKYITVDLKKMCISLFNRLLGALDKG